MSPYHELNVAEFLEHTERGALLLDVRDYHDISPSSPGLKGAQRLPAKTITADTAGKVIPSKETELLLFCNFSLIPSKEAMMSRQLPAIAVANETLHKLGYHSIYVLKIGSHDDKDFSRLPLVTEQH